MMKFQIKHAKFKHPSNTMIVGMTGSGKTRLMIKILHNFQESFYNLDEPQLKVLWCYGQWHHLIGIDIHKNVLINYSEGIPDDQLIEKFKPNIIFIDDLLNEMSSKKDFENIFIKKSHHLNIS